MSICCVTIWLALMLLPVTVLAQCPMGVQETVVLYLNGVDTTKGSAKDSMKKLNKEVSKVPGVLTDCIKYDYVYNTNEPLFLDFLEAGLQKANEQGLNATDFWRWFFRISPLTSGFADLLVDFYAHTSTSIDLGRFVLGDQVDEHLAKYREYLSQGKRIIIASHSQGSLYANEEWERLTAGEKSQVNVIAVATPTNHIAKNGPYTTLMDDRIARFLFPLALPANASNTEPCADDWTCHGFKESYMRGENSREKIVEEIVSFLPIMQEDCRIEGIVKNWDLVIVNGGDVRLLDSVTGNIIKATSSNSTGRYCITNVSDGFYFIEASKNDELLGGRDIWLRSTQTAPLAIDFPIAYQM
jgi:hypothetical protein